MSFFINVLKAYFCIRNIKVKNLIVFFLTQEKKFKSQNKTNVVHLKKREKTQ